MFGIYRFLLACMVVCGHTWFSVLGRPNWVGTYAVFGFYVLSGYLMTRVLHETYGYGPRAILRFLGNRALRIFPAYWCAMALMVGLLVAVPDITGKGNWMVYLPRDISQWFFSIVILGIDYTFTPRLVPPSWSLHVEICFYLLLALGLSRTRTITVLWVAASAAWTAYAVSTGVPFGERYATVLGGSLAFGAGSLAYFSPSPSSPVAATPIRVLLAVAFFFHTLVTGFVYQSSDGPAFYFSLLLATVATVALRDVRPAPRARAIDNRLGDLAYPIFLLHMPVAYLVQWLFPVAAGPPRSWYLATMPPLLLASFLLNRFVEKPIERARARVRGVEIGARKTARGSVQTTHA